MNEIAHLANRQVRAITGAAASGLGSARPAHVSRRGNRFTLFDAAGNSRPVALMDAQGNVYIDVIIVDANPNPSRMYFEGGWSEDDSGPPTCFSDNGTGPSTLSAVPQSATCAGCPQSAWGSAVSKLTGQAIPACQSSKKLAVLVLDQPDEIIYEFVVTPGSWSDKQTGWKRYVNSIAAGMIGNRKAELCDVVTRIKFLPGKMGIMGFEPLRMISVEEAEMVDDAWASETTQQIVGMTDKARDPALPVAPKPQALPAPAAQPVPPPQPANPPPLQFAPSVPPRGEVQETPKRRRGRPPGAVAATPSPNPTPMPPAGAAEIPPFLQRPQPQPAPIQAAPTPAPTNGQFGMTTPAAPDQALKDALAEAFKLPT